jgi:hypothetical protein
MTTIRDGIFPFSWQRPQRKQVIPVATMDFFLLP